jgi:hypothetical protein
MRRRERPRAFLEHVGSLHQERCGPGPIRFNGSVDSNISLVIDATGVGVGPNSAVVTQPGAVIVNGQSVIYTNLASIGLPGSTAINASVAALYLTPDDAFIKGYSGTMFSRPIYMSPSEHFVQVLYLDVLGRAGTLAEVDGWASLLNGPGGSQAAVAASIEGSFEARDRLVKTWYATYLGREAQGGEELGWVNDLSTQTEEQVPSGILGSSEFFGRAQGLMPTGTPTERYVQALYQVLLGRSASSAEAVGWNAGLPALGNQGAALAFLHSQEFRTDQFGGILQRSATPPRR